MHEAIDRLEAAGIPTARLDVLVLLEDTLGKDRAHILAHPETKLSNAHISTLNEQIGRRTLHVPLAYIRGKTEFYGREFLVDDRVLEPRPESETMIELLKNVSKPAELTIIDVGTGSGALAITAKLALPAAKVIAIDIDPHCLELARSNADRHTVQLDIVEGDLLSPIAGRQPGRYALLCNLPYVPDNFQINQAATHEPRLAIFGGPDGLDPYRRLFAQIDSLQHKPAYVLTEAMPPQHEELADIAAEHSYRLVTSDDFIQAFEPNI